MTPLLVTAAITVVVFLPGYLLLGVLRPLSDLTTKVAASVPLSAGLYYAAALWLSLAQVHVGWVLAVPTTIVLLSASFTVRRRHHRRDVLPNPAWPWDLIACAVGSMVILTVFLAGMGGLDQVPTHDDGYNHGYFAARIMATGTIDPGVVLTLDAQSTEQAIAFYPMVTHLQAALVSWTTGLDLAASFTAVVMIGLAVALPSGMLLLTQQLFDDLRWTGPAAAILAAAVPALSYSATWGGMFPSVLGLAAVPAIAVLACRWATEQTPSTLALVTLGLVGLFGIHSSAAAFCVLVAIVLSLMGKEIMTWRRRMVAGLCWGFCTAVLLGPALVDLAGGWSERRSTDQSFNMSVFEGLVQVLVLRDFASGPSPLALAILSWGGLGLCLARRVARPWTWFVLWLTLMYVALSLWRHPALIMVASPWYASPARFATMFVFAMVPLAAFCLTTAVKEVSRDRVGLLLRSIVVALGVATVTDGLVQGGGLVGSNYRDFSTVGPDDRRAYRWLADNVEPDQRVLNGQADGSQWMYALAGVVPVNSTKVVEGHEVHDREKLARDAGSIVVDPTVNALVRRLNVRFAFIGDNKFHGRDNVLRKQALESSPYWREVFRAGEVRVYEASLGSMPAGAASSKPEDDR